MHFNLVLVLQFDAYGLHFARVLFWGLIRCLQERNIVPSLKKAVNDISLEKDAAAVAKVLDCLRVYGIHDSDMSNPHYHFYLVC